MAALFFDYFGTIVDNYSIAEALVPYVYSYRKAGWIAEEWRRHQKWMMFYLALAERFYPHPKVTEAALRYALAKFHADVPEAGIQDIMSKYRRLKAFPDVPEGLKKLKKQGHVLRVVANPARWMLEQSAEEAGIRQHFEEIISTSDEAKAFKPSPRAFQLGLTRAVGERVLWVTAHFWEIIGADGLGIKTAWVNRLKVPHDHIGVTPTYEPRTLIELGDILDKNESA